MYHIKLRAQDIVKKSDGIYFSLAEPLRAAGDGDKLVAICRGKFSDVDMSLIRRDIVSPQLGDTLDFGLERIPIRAMDANGKLFTLKNQHDPMIPHSFRVTGGLVGMFGSIRSAVGGGPRDYTVTIDPWK